MRCDLTELSCLKVDPSDATREELEPVEAVQNLQLAGDKQLARRTTDKERLLPHVISEADRFTNRVAKDNRRVEAVEVVDDAWSIAFEKWQDELGIALGLLQTVCITQRLVVVDLSVNGTD
jgi:hypothetical protein